MKAASRACSAPTFGDGSKSMAAPFSAEGAFPGAGTCARCRRSITTRVRWRAWRRGCTSTSPAFAARRYLERFEGGQSNPTYKLVAESGAYVLRRKPRGELLAERTRGRSRVPRSCARSPERTSPSPQALALCDDDAVIGSAFYVMEFVPGRVFWD